MIILAAEKNLYGEGTGCAETKNRIYAHRLAPEVWKGVSGSQNLETVTHFTAVVSYCNNLEPMNTKIPKQGR